MSYGRILKPRVYACHAAHLALRGTAPGDIVSIVGGAALNAGSDVRDLISMRPQAGTSFDLTAAPTTHIAIAFDFQAYRTISFVALLGHNLATAGARLRVAHGATQTGPGQGTEVALTYRVGEKEEVTGALVWDGATVVTFSPTARQHWTVELEDDNGFNADATIGAVLIGSYWDAPYGPDMDVSRSYEHDGVEVVETRGGKRYGHAAWVTGSDGSALPFGAAFRGQNLSAASEMQSGRRVMKMSFSRLTDSIVAPSDFSDDIQTTLGWRSLVSLTGGGALPCIFTPDGTSTTAGDYMLARMKAGDEKQVAPRVWTVDATFEEEF